MSVVNSTVQQWLDEASADADAFWGRAAERCHWFRPWDETFVWEPPTFRWFTGGQTNISYNAIDLHIERRRGQSTALIALDERGGRRLLSYDQLLTGVKQISRALRG